MIGENIKRPLLIDEFTLEQLRQKFTSLKKQIGTKKLLGILIEYNPQYNIVRHGKYNDYKNVLSNQASLLATYDIVMILEDYLKNQANPTTTQKKNYLKKIKASCNK